MRTCMYHNLIPRFSSLLCHTEKSRYAWGEEATCVPCRQAGNAFSCPGQRCIGSWQHRNSGGDDHSSKTHFLKPQSYIPYTCRSHTTQEFSRIEIYYELVILIHYTVTVNITHATHMHARTHTRHTHTRTHTHTCTHTHMHVHTHARHTHICTHTHMHAHTHMHVIHTYVRTHTPAHIHIRMHTHTNTHTHTYAHTHTHTYTHYSHLIVQ